MNEVIIIIHWADPAQQQPISKEALEVVEQKFLASLGAAFQLVESKQYQVRKTINLY